MSSTTIFAVIVALSNAVVAVFSYILARHNTKNSKQAKKEEQIAAAEDKLEDACNNGTLSELIDAAKKIGEAKQ